MRQLALPAMFVLALLPLATGCGRAGGTVEGTVSAQPKAEALSRPATSEVKVQLLDFDGIEQLVASHRGRVVVMDAWSLACPPCIREFPKLVALQKRHGQDRLRCISLSFDYDGIGEPSEKLPRVTAFLEKHQATFDNVLGSEESDALCRKLKLYAVPAVFVYDKAGVLRQRFDNQQAKTKAETFTYDQVDKLVAELLAEPEPSSPSVGSSEKVDSPQG